ncbi:sensor histidine kinase [Actinotignum sanguinis]|uniref:histidine kinase n=1 Tax=Schaalia turicensis TaxID=131111 RepID=A0ABZ0RAK3_9ACTO|nr:HAMP domain-containing sensor histidine kinase [Actinotignum sanguinis]WPJ88459.1 HAMP domain-containing sensor histidine kinase [Schaalia turicensis]MDK8513063.1 HAMP domain-containing sensor histidine kinase [Actinotignum sanguinis]MDK8518499.1 HAMP domain-containing sensor histidine kinase [Actinotignum sanguinis]MDK8748067.1 HAMP domain-containing sensor histidine kinase [Actinotignum sanguinis]MDV2437825.1 HAMP domain-containing sensor histidine kinase [Actinotignum sanguinis]
MTQRHDPLPPESAGAPPLPSRPAQPGNPATESPARNHRGGVFRRALRPARTLAGRLIIAFVILVGTAATFLGFASVTLLKQYLVSTIDQDLTTNARSVERMFLQELPGASQSSPLNLSDFFVRVNWGIAGQREVTTYELPNPGAVEEFGYPRELDRIASLGSEEPVTVPSTLYGSDWRVLVHPISPASTGGLITGNIIIAQPLGPIEFTIARLRLIFVLAGLATVLAAGLAVTGLVSRTLRSLRDIEAATHTIAEGHLAERVPHGQDDDEVGMLAKSINVMLAQIEHAFAEKERSEAKMRRFVSDASHELRTPLATVRGYSELYRLGGVPPERVPEAMERVESEANRMAGLVEDLLQLARLDENRPLNLDCVNLAKLADNAILDFRVRAPQRTATVVALDGSTPPPAMVEVHGDADRITQVIANLLSNVLAHAPEASPVEVAVGIAEGQPTIEVRDHGPGISEADSQRIFERFYRPDYSRSRESGGSGLGLAIVAAIMAAHHGTARALTTPGGGLTVQLTFPAPTEPCQNPASPS